MTIGETGWPEPGPGDDHDLPLDAHLHTDLSPDSRVPIDLYCAEAVERGIPEIAITDHLDFDPRAPAFAFADFARRERVVRQAAERWADHGLAVRFGVEITYQASREEEIRQHLAHHPYDYAIGSVHVDARSPYAPRSIAGWIAGRSFAEIVAPYFDEVTAAARSGLFDTIGHLDKVKKNLVRHLPAGAFDAAPEAYEPILRALVESGTALEVNSSGLRQEPRETYPAAWVVARFRQLGGERVTVGSDAHRVPDFAWGLGRASRITGAAGFEALAFRRRAGEVRAGVRIPLPGRFHGEARAAAS